MPVELGINQLEVLCLWKLCWQESTHAVTIGCQLGYLVLSLLFGFGHLDQSLFCFLKLGHQDISLLLQLLLFFLQPGFHVPHSLHMDHASEPLDELRDGARVGSLHHLVQVLELFIISFHHRLQLPFGVGQLGLHMRHALTLPVESLFDGLSCVCYSLHLIHQLSLQLFSLLSFSLNHFIRLLLEECVLGLIVRDHVVELLFQEVFLALLV
mmetsp:Transcript_47896/g.74791  ORF Transcript_47896/g.74791 Transcript_47896/m.74791 type:complete len:211 (+) Transcript_47896:2065-2697(+)